MTMKLMNCLKYMLIGLLVSSCSTDRLSYFEYVSDPDHGLIKEVTTDSWIYTLQYRAPEFLALVELDDRDVSKQEFDVLLKEYADLEYYLLTIRGKSLKKVDSNLSQKNLSFDFKDQIRLNAQANGLKPILFHYEGWPESLGEHRFIVGFQRQDHTDREITILEFDVDKGVQLNISKEAISKIPELSI